MDDVDKQSKVARIVLQLVANLEEIDRARTFATAEGWPAPVVNALATYAATLKTHARNRVTAIMDGSDASPV